MGDPVSLGWWLAPARAERLRRNVVTVLRRRGRSEAFWRKQ
jgi:hypothetical protein